MTNPRRKGADGAAADGAARPEYDAGRGARLALANDNQSPEK